MKIKSKLQVGFGIVGVIFLLTSILTLFSYRKFNASITEITDKKLPSIVSISDVNTQTSNHMILAFMHATTTTDDEMTYVETEITKVEGIIEKERTLYESLMSDDTERELYSKFEKNYTEYLDYFKEFLTLSRANQNEEAQAVIKTKLTPVFVKYSKNLDDIVADVKNDSEEMKSALGKQYKQIIVSIIITGVILLGLLVIIIFCNCSGIP